DLEANGFRSQSRRNVDQRIDLCDDTPGTGMSFIDRLSYFISLPTARKFNRLSLQVSPMVARFNTASPERERQLMALGMAAGYRLSERYSMGLEYLPVLNPRNPDTTNAMAVVLDIETGGHIFQL